VAPDEGGRRLPRVQAHRRQEVNRKNYHLTGVACPKVRLVSEGSRCGMSARNTLRRPIMETIKELAQILYYLTLSVAGPIALIEFLRARKSYRRANEYKIYDELNDRFFEYQKIALEYYDLDILDVPNNDPSLAFDKKRKQEMVAHSILFSLLERAFLMFHQQEDQFRLRQWSGWKHFLNDFIRRETVRSAWRLSRETYDTDFQHFMDEKIAAIQPHPSPQLAQELLALQVPVAIAAT
jgi:hypothetical protein